MISAAYAAGAMLPPDHRMRLRDEFTAAVRRGDRAGRPRLVLHLRRGPDADEPARIGFTVGRLVGNAVVRNKVRRRLRHLLRERLVGLPQGSLLVVRANPKAATARYDELAADLDAALERLLPAHGSWARRGENGNRAGRRGSDGRGRT